MRVVHVLQGLHGAGIEHLALQLINHAPAGVENHLLNLDASVQDLRPAFERQCKANKLRTITDCFPCDGMEHRTCFLWEGRVVMIAWRAPF